MRIYKWVPIMGNNYPSDQKKKQILKMDNNSNSSDKENLTKTSSSIADMIPGADDSNTCKFDRTIKVYS